MPRSNRPRRRGRPAALPPGDVAPGDVPPGDVAPGLQRWVDAPDGEWVVRSVTGAAALKAYRCPGCDHEVPAGTPHVVAWPAVPLAGDGLVERRHWHTPCWQARGRRAPSVRR